MVRPCRFPPSDRVAHDRAGHAVPATAAFAKLEALDRDDLDPGFAHLRDRERVALIGDDDAGFEPGRRLTAWIPATTCVKAVALSRSSRVKTVSRCMWARSLVMTAAMTRSAAPFAKRALAICSIIRPVVRSDMPIATVPLPMISTSPPSSEAWPK